MIMVLKLGRERLGKTGAARPQPLASSDEFRRRLRSADVDTCIVPRTRTRFGDRSISDAGPGSGTAYRRICGGQTLSLANSVDY